MKQGIIIAHGPLGAALIEAAKSIMGSDEGLYPISVTDMSVHEIESRLNAMIDEPRTDVEGIIIMACLRGGSSWNVSAALIKDKPTVRLVSGCNLAMVLSFLINRNSLTIDELVQKMHQEASQGITVFHG
ncbi:MAG: hypothetical protein EHM72_06980 [Calditrichaeota bacterium]|nr:MAG: hypothetical protein EHM72_06980 [Calditrichota bacterium]